MNITINC